MGRETEPSVKPDRDLAEHYRHKDGLVRAFVKSHYVALRAMQASVEGLRLYLENYTNLTPLDVAALIAAVEADAPQAASRVNDDELLRQVEKVLLPMARNRVQRATDKDSKARQKSSFGPSSHTLLKRRQKRQFAIFGRETVSSAVGAILCGPPALVVQAMAAVKCAALADEQLRTVRCEDSVSRATWVKEPSEGPVRAVTFFAPWWDCAVSNLDQFRKMVRQAEEQFGGETDVLVFDDLARVLKNMNTAKNVPQDYVSRATWTYRRLASMMKRKGGVLVAGLKYREGERYDPRDLAALSEACRMYDLSKEGDLLYATDGYGNNHLIPEPRDEPCQTSTSSPTTSSAA